MVPCGSIISTCFKITTTYATITPKWIQTADGIWPIIYILYRSLLKSYDVCQQNNLRELKTNWKWKLNKLYKQYVMGRSIYEFPLKKTHVRNKPKLEEMIMITRTFKINIWIFRKHEFCFLLHWNFILLFHHLHLPNCRLFFILSVKEFSSSLKLLLWF